MPQPAIPAKRALPSKEATLFKDLLTLFETRQLKKGQKTADQILKKFPEHGETLCMKGLILTHMGKREEGVELVKKGVVLDLTSHISWHVFGLIQKIEKNYEEALKSYAQALRFDKDNTNILRDAAQLQAQLRVFDGLIETRHTLLRLRPTLRQNWIGLAVAYHLNGNLQEANKVLEHYQRIIQNIPEHDVEHSETLFYHVRLLEELGQFSRSLDLLEASANSGAMVDPIGVMEIRARLLSKLGSDQAESAWRALIERNPDCRDYYRDFFAHQGITLGSVPDEIRPKVLATLQDFSTHLPRASVPRRLALTIATGDTFTKLATQYLTSGLTKGVPSLFADVKSLYHDDEKRLVIEQIVETAREHYQPAEDISSPSPSAPDEPPTTYLWILYFLAQHYSSLSQHSRALSLLSTALAHTPTLPELYTCKARVLKRAGDYYGAARYLDEARLLDGQDRFLNTKCAKYRFRAGMVEEGVEILGLFTKKDAVSPSVDLEDMQSLFYLTEEGDAHYRSGKWNLALKKYYAIQKIFDEVEDDQYDFHGYSLRKFTADVYMEFIKWEDHLRSHPTYVSAAILTSRIFVAVFDNPSIVTSLSSANLTSEEKKNKKKAKKAAQKAQEAVKKAPANSASANEDKLDAAPAKDDDPDGLKLISCSDPLERAAKCLNPLRTLARQNIDAWIAAYDVAIRRKKYVQAAQALNQARMLDAENAELHIRTVDFRKTVSELPQPLVPPIGPVIDETLSAILPNDVSLETHNSQYLQRHSTSAPAIIAAAKVWRKLNAPLEEVEACVFTVFVEGVIFDIKNALIALAFLKDIKSPRLEEFREACDLRFELSTVFKTPAEQVELRKAAVVAGEVVGAGESEKSEMIE